MSRFAVYYAPMKQQLLIFDLDGTLADSRQDLATSVNQMRAHYQLEAQSFETIMSFIGDGVRKLVARSLEGESIDFDEALAYHKVCYNKCMLDQTALYADVAEGLKTMDNHVLAVLSNKPGDPSRAIMNHLGLGETFIRIIGGGDMPALKPAPDGINALLESTGISKEDTWMIGDHHTDLEAAKNAGVQAGFVTYGIGNPGGFEATQTWDNFADLVSFFAEK